MPLGAGLVGARAAITAWSFKARPISGMPNRKFSLLKAARNRQLDRPHKRGDAVVALGLDVLASFSSESTRCAMRELIGLAICLAFAVSAQGQPARQTQTFQTDSGAVKITPIYHASLLIEAGGRTIYLDPAKPSNFEGLPPADLILITDIHPDHMDLSSIAKISKPGTEIWSPPAVVQTVTAAHPISNGETKHWNGWTVDAIPMYNIKRGPAPGELYHPKGRGNGYVLTYGHKRFYFSGDTENIPEMRALKNIDVAFVCMNLPYTMPPDEAAEAVKAFHPRIVIPYHYRGSDLSVFRKDLEGTGIEVRLLDWYPQSE